MIIILIHRGLECPASINLAALSAIPQVLTHVAQLLPQKFPQFNPRIISR